MKLSLYCFFLFSLLLTSSSAASKKSYIVYLGAHSHGPNPSSSDVEKVSSYHHDLLDSFLGGNDKARESIFYSYTKFINGFAAYLEEEAAARIAMHPDVVSVFPDEAVRLQTTRSWEFMTHLEENGQMPDESLWEKARYGEDAIIGNIDTGVWGQSKSFDDDGLGAVPTTKWRGQCDKGVECNRKLIGARVFGKGFAGSGYANSSEDYISARDFNGHGTHTLSTAGGRPVPWASIFGYANGTARGGSSRGRVAAYKACFASGFCQSSDIMENFDAAIYDGVDILSISLGSFPGPYFSDSIAIGAFHAICNNILVIASAGNDGPSTGSVANVAPWFFTVAASTIDRKISSSVVLENGTRFTGESLSTAVLKPGKTYPIIYSIDAKRPDVHIEEAKFCLEDTLDKRKVRGKLVVCMTEYGVEVESGEEVRRAGGAGLVLVLGPSMDITAAAHILPATVISREDGLTLLSYIRAMTIQNRTIRGNITRPVTVLGSNRAPVMARFSSRGPNIVTPEILKPDITAPGVDILAAYTQAKAPTYLSIDKRRVAFTMMSGTSMSSPHIAGIAGLLKTLHPEWSPAAIRSAMMTTATTQNPISSGDDPFGFGTGHVQPNAAMDPGLVYDLSPRDYLNFLCSIGYTAEAIKMLTTDSYSCEALDLLNFNYPSITVPNLNGSVTVSRIVKNVGSPGTYTATVEAPHGVLVSIKPTQLKFDKHMEMKMFNVTLQAKSGGGGYVFGKLTWSDGTHNVRSPIVVNVITP
ncbi:subtilisin-like protease SBT5.3 [Aristolochia californica]|uniref:subtilisin-like protease SBT5.3 n=1 Tax=Aristolochia californica TaxID=171875 RepID=UPI0035D566E0